MSPYTEHDGCEYEAGLLRESRGRAALDLFTIASFLFGNIAQEVEGDVMHPDSLFYPS